MAKGLFRTIRRNDGDDGVFGVFCIGMDLQGRDPKKSRNLIAVLCCFCEWIDFWRFLRFRDGVAGNGDVAPPGWCDFEWKRWGQKRWGPEKNADFGAVLHLFEDIEIFRAW